MKCENPDCQCLSHVDPSTHIPTCPYCAIPLEPTEADPSCGYCPNGRPWSSRTCPAKGRVFTHHAWRWLPRDNFAGDDLPPATGWKPIEVKEEWL